MNPQEIEQTIQRVEEFCKLRDARLTPIRREVLTLVLSSSDVIKAYEILSALQKTRTNAAPPTVYRALDFLVEIGVLHRAEALNGFIFCAHFDHPHSGVILNCKSCGRTQEADAPRTVNQLHEFCEDWDFELSDEPLVLNGLCERCR